MKNDEFLIKSIGNVKTSLNEKVIYNLYLMQRLYGGGGYKG